MPKIALVGGITIVIVSVPEPVHCVFPLLSVGKYHTPSETISEGGDVNVNVVFKPLTVPVAVRTN